MKRNRPSPVRRKLPRGIASSTIIDLGGIGRQAALQLAALGVPRLQLLDPRAIARTTYAAHGYAYEAVGRMRVHATAQACHEINPQLDMNALAKRSLRGGQLGDAVLCCPGSPSIWRALGRLAGNETVIARCDVTGGTLYLEFARGAASLAGRLGRHTPLGTARRITRRSAVAIHVATVAAGLLVAEFIRFTAGGQRWRAVRFDLQTLHIEVEELS